MQTTPGHNSRAPLCGSAGWFQGFQHFAFCPWSLAAMIFCFLILFLKFYSHWIIAQHFHFVKPQFLPVALGAFPISKSCRPGRNAQKRFFSSLLSLTSNSNSNSNLTYVYSLYTECIRLVYSLYTSPYTVLYTERNTKCIRNAYDLYTACIHKSVAFI